MQRITTILACLFFVLLALRNSIVSFHGQYDDVSRDSKKNAAISMVKLLYDRIPGLLRK